MLWYGAVYSVLTEHSPVWFGVVCYGSLTGHSGYGLVWCCLQHLHWTLSNNGLVWCFLQHIHLTLFGYGLVWCYLQHLHWTLYDYGLVLCCLQHLHWTLSGMVWCGAVYTVQTLSLDTLWVWFGVVFCTTCSVDILQVWFGVVCLKLWFSVLVYNILTIYIHNVVRVVSYVVHHFQGGVAGVQTEGGKQTKNCGNL